MIPPEPVRRDRSWMLIAVLALTALVLVPMLFIGFLNDDIDYIRFALKGERPHLAEIFTTREVTGPYFRPLVSVAFVVDYVVWGWNAFGYRLTNFILHLLSTLLVFLLARRLLASRAQALLAAALFGVMPIHELSLFWLPGRTDLLCSVFFLASLLFYLSFLNKQRTVLLAVSLLSFLGALLSKEMAFSLPAVIALLVWWSRRREGMRMWFLAAAKAAVPYALVAAGVLLVRWVALDNNPLFGEQGLHGTVDIGHLLRNVASYIGLLVIPFGHYEIEQLLSRYPSLFLAGAAGVVLLSALLLWKPARRHPEILLGVFWVLLTLIPVSRLMMRWYLYLPSVGFSLLLGWAIAQLSRERVKRMIALTAVPWLLYSALLLDRSAGWIVASRIAEHIVDDLVAGMTVQQGHETIVFASIPAKLGTTPLLHLGLRSTLRHRLGEDSLDVEIWSRVVMERYPSTITLDMLDDGGVRIGAGEDAVLQIDHSELMTRRKTAEAGTTLRIRDLSITLNAVNADNKPVEIVCTPDRVPERNLFYFDGFRFVRVR